MHGSTRKWSYLINWKSSRRENTLLTILIAKRLTVTCQHSADMPKANMIWKSIRSYVTSRDRKAEMSLHFRNSTWKSGYPHSRKLTTNQWQKRASKMLQKWRTSLKADDKKALQNNQPTTKNCWAKPVQQNKCWENDPYKSVKIQKTAENIGLLYLNFQNWLLRLRTWQLIQVSHLLNFEF